MHIFKTSAERIKFARNMLSLSRKEMCDKFDISVNTMQSWEIGRNQLTKKGAKKLSQIFILEGLYCSDEWLLKGEGQFPALLEKAEPISGALTEGMKILREAEAFKAINANPVVVIIRDSGMQPIYNIGDYVAGNKRTDLEIPHIIGTNCIVETAQGDMLVRRLLKSSKKSHFDLSCINNYSLEQPIIHSVKLNYAAQIVWHRTREILMQE